MYDSRERESSRQNRTDAQIYDLTGTDSTDDRPVQMQSRQNPSTETRTGHEAPPAIDLFTTDT